MSYSCLDQLSVVTLTRVDDSTYTLGPPVPIAAVHRGLKVAIQVASFTHSEHGFNTASVCTSISDTRVSAVFRRALQLYREGSLLHCLHRLSAPTRHHMSALLPCVSSVQCLMYVSILPPTEIVESMHIAVLTTRLKRLTQHLAGHRIRRACSVDAVYTHHP